MELAHGQTTWQEQYYSFDQAIKRPPALTSCHMQKMRSNAFLGARFRIAEAITRSGNRYLLKSCFGRKTFV